MREVNKRTSGDLFSKHVCYVIPTFQRPYKWGREKQWEPLWDDVRNTAERFEDALAANGGNQTAAEKATDAHFLGAVVIQQEDTATGETARRRVIDGQQRMTTLQILLDAAQEQVAAAGQDRPAKLLRKLILNDPDPDVTTGDDVFKLWPTLNDRAAFRAAMDDDADASEFAEHPVVRAHQFFGACVEDWLTAADDPAARAAALYVTLAGLLELVVIDLETDDDAYVIFETLNARGTPLLASDLVKNFLMRRAADRGTNAEALHKRYWQPLETPYWQEDVQQGRLVRPRLDVLLNYWLIARTREEVASHRVFPAFQAYAGDEDGRDADELAADVAGVAAAYRRWDDPAAYTPFSPEGTFLYRWRVTQAGVLTPLLLTLFAAPSESLPVPVRRRALAHLESFLVRRMLCGLTTKDYNRLFLDLLGRVEDRIGDADAVIRDFLREQDAHSRAWPGDAELRDTLKERPVYRLLSRGRLRMVLEAIEDHLRSAKTEDDHVSREKKLTIEHILPQGWMKHWGIPPTGDEDRDAEAVDRRNSLLHTLGNLTLLTKKLNPSLSNAEWDHKKVELFKHSSLSLTTQLLTNYPKFGDGPDVAIVERSASLADACAEVWPRPQV